MAHIVSIEDLGTIVKVNLSDGQPVIFDHRPFHWMVEARGGDLGGECHLAHNEDDSPTLVFEEALDE